MKIGDVVLNTCAGENNPHRYGMVIGFSSVKTNRYHSSPIVKVMHSSGKTSQYYRKNKFLQVVGCIPLFKQIDALVQQNSETVESCQLPTTQVKSSAGATDEHITPTSDSVMSCEGCPELPGDSDCSGKCPA